MKRFKLKSPKSQKKIKGILYKVSDETMDKNTKVISNILDITPKKAKGLVSAFAHIIKEVK